MARRFDDLVIWITGAGSGIGRALAIELARRGGTIICSGRRREKLDEVVAAIESTQGRAEAVVCDVTDESSIHAAVEKILNVHAKIDVIVANAGFGVAGRIEKLAAADWRRQFETNVIGAVATVKAALPSLRATRGRVVFVASVASLTPYPSGGPYASSKAALSMIGAILSLELEGSGVTCTTIHPGLVESEIAQVDNQGRFSADRDDPRPSSLMWPAERAARVMADAIHRRKREFVFTFHGKVGAFLGRHLPGALHFAMRRGAGKRVAPPAP